VEPIGELGVAMAGGFGAVCWPNTILVLVSDDNETYYQAAELVGATYNHTLPPWRGLAVGKSIATEYALAYRAEVATYGRYVRFVILSSEDIICSDIKVLAGNPAMLGQPRGEVVEAKRIPELLSKGITEREMKRRMLQDLGQITARARDLKTLNSKLLQRCKDFANEIRSLAAEDIQVPERIILPFSPLHKRVYALFAEVLKGNGFDSLVVWPYGPYEPIIPLMIPNDSDFNAFPELPIMPGQHRCRVLNLTNANSEPMEVAISITGAGNDGAQWITPQEVLFTGTMFGRVLATALLPLEAAKSSYTMTPPAGMTKQL